MLLPTGGGEGKGRNWMGRGRGRIGVGWRGIDELSSVFLSKSSTVVEELMAPGLEILC